DLGRALHGVHVGLRAHDDPDERGVDFEALELGLNVGDGPRRFAHGSTRQHEREAVATHRTPAAMSRRSCLPGNSITSAPAYAASRAASGSSPSAVTFSTRPPAVTSPPPGPLAVPACVTSTPSGTSSRPLI